MCFYRNALTSHTYSLQGYTMYDNSHTNNNKVMRKFNTTNKLVCQEGRNNSSEMHESYIKGINKHIIWHTLKRVDQHTPV